MYFSLTAPPAWLPRCWVAERVSVAVVGSVLVVWRKSTFGPSAGAKGYTLSGLSRRRLRWCRLEVDHRTLVIVKAIMRW